MAYVYRHIRLDKNEPFYIGIGSDVDYCRANERARRNKLWKRIAAKTRHEVEIILDGVSFDAAKEKEKEFIALYGRIDLGTGSLANMTDGGDGTKNKVVSDEYRRKLSIAAKKRIIPPEQRKKIADSRRGKKFTAEQRERVRLALKGRKLSQKQILQISERMKENNPMSGVRGKICANTKYKIIAEKDGVFVGEYHGMYECARELNLQATKINAVLKGKRNHTGGYKFKSVAL